MLVTLHNLLKLHFSNRRSLYCSTHFWYIFKFIHTSLSPHPAFCLSLHHEGSGLQSHIYITYPTWLTCVKKTLKIVYLHGKWTLHGDNIKQQTIWKTNHTQWLEIIKQSEWNCKVSIFKLVIEIKNFPFQQEKRKEGGSRAWGAPLCWVTAVIPHSFSELE